MTRQAVADAMEGTTERLMAFMAQELRPSAVVAGMHLPIADSVINRVARPQIRDAFAEIGEDLSRQHTEIIDQAVDAADGNEAVPDDRFERFLAYDPVYNSIDASEDEAKERLREQLRDHLAELGVMLAPIVAHDSDKFWDALVVTYTSQEARKLLDLQLEQLDRFVAYSEHITFTHEVDIPAGLFTHTRTLDVTDEALRVIQAAAERFRTDLYDQIDAVYQS